MDEVATSLGITYNTARTHLKRIYKKTRTNRISSLIHLIITGPVGVVLHTRD
jgi:DNA-binding CsgD family transcriptional regulator